MSCLFCNYPKEKYIVENAFAFAIYDNFPVNEGHALIIPKRHFESFFEATEEEVKGIYKLLHEVKRNIDKKYKPDGYNVGINVGEYGGQTIMHLHVHLIPRYKGDVENPRGGIRKFKKELVEYDG
ncbi:AP-4-A phosphorylase [Clostridium homopropionicum DSM 5847]|uniref:AP-4-A phosphorylase n=1 Tax=Clostridium homopropionicum DSM 5847 TaxID=1121318 RepID=A0A0L6Z5E9_9CLOT|nr:HIT family protein [Clostridium homopropionicum]KOA18068.1 AP-4-A phosphorylase [Clostridium homopropionicum DSM 5847]SFH01163.1 Diadenosine tetraphosphate (Ap4A) hydrolase [Clostridium homopropionicum]